MTRRRDASRRFARRRARPLRLDVRGRRSAVRSGAPVWHLTEALAAVASFCRRHPGLCCLLGWRLASRPAGRALLLARWRRARRRHGRRHPGRHPGTPTGFRPPLRRPAGGPAGPCLGRAGAAVTGVFRCVNDKCLPPFLQSAFSDRWARGSTPRAHQVEQGRLPGPRLAAPGGVQRGGRRGPRGVRVDAPRASLRLGAACDAAIKTIIVRLSD